MVNILADILHRDIENTAIRGSNNLCRFPLHRHRQYSHQSGQIFGVDFLYKDTDNTETQTIQQLEGSKSCSDFLYTDTESTRVVIYRDTENITLDWSYIVC